MIDPISLAIGGALLGVGWVAGRIARLKSSPRQKELKPICMCGHHYGAHSPDTGACNDGEDEQRWDSKRGTHFVTTTCTCLRYTGPQPIEQYWVPPTADMSIVTAPRALFGEEKSNG